MRFPHGPGFGFLGGVVESILAGLVFIICFVVVVGLLFVLVRFLLVATKAAELYLANNTPRAPATPGALTRPVATATPGSTTAPAPRPRPAKTPPTN